jgi:hypothetical protein
METAIKILWAINLILSFYFLFRSIRNLRNSRSLLEECKAILSTLRYQVGEVD